MVKFEKVERVLAVPRAANEGPMLVRREAMDRVGELEMEPRTAEAWRQIHLDADQAEIDRINRRRAGLPQTATEIERAWAQVGRQAVERVINPPIAEPLPERVRAPLRRLRNSLTLRLRCWLREMTGVDAVIGTTIAKMQRQEATLATHRQALHEATALIKGLRADSERQAQAIAKLAGTCHSLAVRSQPEQPCPSPIRSDGSHGTSTGQPAESRMPT